jgi:glutaredoxin 3
MRAKELLRIKGIPFVEYVINGDPSTQAELRRRGAGDTVPKIYIANRLIDSCGELFALDERGELDTLLSSLPESPQ